MKKLLLTFSLVALLGLAAGCTTTEKANAGLVTGGVAGGVVGGAIGGTTGAVIGATGGALVGHEVGKNM